MKLGICLVRLGKEIRNSPIEERLSDNIAVHSPDLLVAVGLHARRSGGFSVGSCERLGVSLVEHRLEDLLLLGAEDLGQVLVELRLLGLEVCRKN